MKKKRYAYVPKKLSGKELQQHLEETFNSDTLYHQIMGYFKRNPKKTVAKIKLSSGFATVRKYEGGFYTFIV